MPSRMPSGNLLQVVRGGGLAGASQAAELLPGGKQFAAQFRLFLKSNETGNSNAGSLAIFGPF